MATCSVDECNSPVLARGWCGRHYQRWSNHGDPLAIKTMRGVPPPERFWRQVDKKGPIPKMRPGLGPCWLWTGLVVKTYGQFQITRGLRPYAHRYAYELLVGPIAEGLTVDHLCFNRICVNPEHLEAVTQTENNRRSGNMGVVNSRKTRCPAGHVYDETNTIVRTRPSGGSVRVCRTCNRESQRRYEANRVR